MKRPEPTIRVDVDVLNPGQFFACCGLLELADRLWPGAEGWFEEREFRIRAGGRLDDLVRAATRAELVQLDPDDDTGSPIDVRDPFHPLRLDWWGDGRAGGKELKVWAGTMESVKIARAMQYALRDDRFLTNGLFDVGVIAYDPANPENKVEPYYFDSRRGPNAHSRDVGFSPNDLQMTTTAFPAVELFCLVGLQRALPAKAGKPRVFDYHDWSRPLPPELLGAAVSGACTQAGARAYRFENWYRTGQKKHRAFRSADLINHGD
jgi:CRISPR-associated protein Csx14